jgi:hypothetical protein
MPLPEVKTGFAEAWPYLKVAIAVSVILGANWLANHAKPGLAGFIIALPVSSMLVLAFSYAEYKDPEASIKFAQSILSAIPLSLLFFVPFLAAKKLPFGYWGVYASGVLLLAGGYLAHYLITRQME